MINITNKSNCTGCTACQSICNKGAISMVEDNEGFKYPIVDEKKCVDCHLCEQVCPILSENEHPVISSPLKVYGFKHKDEHILISSSSGAINSSLVNFILENNGVVYGVKYDDSWKAIHARATSKNQVESFKGSKYLQSDIEGIYSSVKDDAEKGLLILFIGTPCQVKGLKLFLRKDYSNVYFVDLICHGVPSPKVFVDYVAWIEKKYKKKISSINMKDKTKGWGNQTLRITFVDDTEIFDNQDSDLWNTIYYSYHILRPSCHTCRFSKYERIGDISIGDFWGVDDIIPEFFDKKGVSLIFANNTKGLSLLEKVLDTGSYVITDIAHCDKKKHNLQNKAPISQERELFWKIYNHSNFVFAKYCFWEKSHLCAKIVKRIFR